MMVTGEGEWNVISLSLASPVGKMTNTCYAPDYPEQWALFFHLLADDFSF
jgi:hypothetical protein